MPSWGCIADDYTGATDLATNFVSRGLRTNVVFGVPSVARRAAVLAQTKDADVVVVALKTRTASVGHAVEASLGALSFLRDVNASRYYVKYCSTFDSTSQGNIGPVIDAVMDELGVAQTIVVPAFPGAGRTVYQGHLFVNGVSLDQSPMRHHPLTPMRDSSVLRLLAPQTRGTVQLISHEIVRDGSPAIATELARLEQGSERQLVVVDTLDDTDLSSIAGAAEARSLRLVTGGSGLALGFGHSAGRDPTIRRIDVAEGLRAVLCGSASEMTRTQIAHAKARHPWWKLDRVLLRRDPDSEAERVVTQITKTWEGDTGAIPIVYAVDSLHDVEPDRPGTGELIEAALAQIAVALVRRGTTQLIVAGGETSGCVVGALGVDNLTIGPQIAPGVVWSAGRDRDGRLLNLALKSGNFGEASLFDAAWGYLASPRAPRPGLPEE